MINKVILYLATVCLALGIARLTPGMPVGASRAVGLPAGRATAGRPADLVMPGSGQVRLRVKRGSAVADEHIFLLVDRIASPGTAWEETYDLGVLTGVNPELNTGVAVSRDDRLDVRVEVRFGDVPYDVRYSVDRDPPPGLPSPRIIDHESIGDRSLCGTQAAEGPMEVTDLFNSADRLVSLTCWEDADDFDYNDFALAVDYTPRPTPTTVPTASAVPTASPRPSRTAMSTPTTTATPTATPTRRPPLVYLPLVLNDPACPPQDRFAAIALVIDASTSMRRTTRNGDRAIDAAIGAARHFLDGLRLRPGGDQVAIIAFNANADVLQTLSSNRADLDAALGRITINGDSRVELGVYRAAAQLDRPAGRQADLRAMVILSDGEAQPVPGEAAVEAAAGAKAEGILVYVIGFGPTMNEAVLRAMATDDRRYWASSEAEALTTIFGEVVRRLLCAPEQYWGRR